LARYLRGSVKVEPSKSFNLSRDPADNKWLEIAYEAGGAIILTWDKDLLSLRDDNMSLTLEDCIIKILTPIEFYHQFLKKRRKA